jgi:hypothetical protein
VLLLRKAGRRIPWEILINEPGLIGRIRTHSCTYGDQKPYDVAVLNVSDSPIAGGIELLEPQLLMLGDQALILRGYEQLQNDDDRLLCCRNGGVNRLNIFTFASHL